MMLDAQTIVEDTLVPHQAFEESTRRVEQCFAYSARASEPVCVALVGESRTGKTRVLEECEERHPPVRDDEGLRTPILRVKTPSKPTVKGLVELMLDTMGDPLSGRGTENSRTARLKTLMRNCGTRMVMIDEFQHFVDKGSQTVTHHGADWLKILVDDSRVALVVAGLPSCQAVLEQNEQLAGRFLAPVFMPRFDWLVDNHREEFVAILNAFHESLGRYFDLPALGGDEMAFRCYCGTGGLIGYLSKFLRQAVWNALDAGKQSISLAELARAHRDAVCTETGPLGIVNPFARDFAAVPNEDLISRVQRIGVAEAPPPATRGTRARRTRKLTAGQVLRAKK